MSLKCCHDRGELSRHQVMGLKCYHVRGELSQDQVMSLKCCHVRGELSQDQVMGLKCCHVRGELSQDQVAPLRSQLLQLISNFAAGPRIVLTRLCIAVSCSLPFAYIRVIP